MAESLEEQARREVYEAGVIVDTFSPTSKAPRLSDLARACDALGVTQPYALRRALAEYAGPPDQK